MAVSFAVERLAPPPKVARSRREHADTSSVVLDDGLFGNRRDYFLFNGSSSTW